MLVEAIGGRNVRTFDYIETVIEVTVEGTPLQRPNTGLRRSSL